MPKKKIKDSKFKTWDSNNEVGAFLYVLFQEGVINPNSYSPVTIYDHPLLNPIFRPYDRRNFGTHCKTLQKREAKHSQYGNVLDPDFKALVKLEKVRGKIYFNNCSIPTASTTVKTTNHTLIKVKTI